MDGWAIHRHRRVNSRSVGYITDAELVVLCGISEATAKSWRANHTGPAYCLAGNTILYCTEDVSNWLEAMIRQIAQGGRVVRSQLL